MQVLKETDFEFKGQKSVYHGKVRDVYNIEDKYMVMVATDQILRCYYKIIIYNIILF